MSEEVLQNEEAQVEETVAEEASAVEDPAEANACDSCQ